MPYVTELSIFAAAFIAAYAYGGPLQRWLAANRRLSMVAAKAQAWVRRNRRF